IVDYLQLMTGTSSKSDNRVQEVSQITTGLKALAKELNIPIIALSQLSRAVENREDKRPQLADLRESGSIEQDADIVMFVFREEYYLERLKPQEGTIEFQDWMAKMQLVSGRAEVIIGKQRRGRGAAGRHHLCARRLTARRRVALRGLRSAPRALEPAGGARLGRLLPGPRAPHGSGRPHRHRHEPARHARGRARSAGRLARPA